MCDVRALAPDEMGNPDSGHPRWTSERRREDRKSPWAHVSPMLIPQQKDAEAAQRQQSQATGWAYPSSALLRLGCRSTRASLHHHDHRLDSDPQPVTHMVSATHHAQCGQT